MCLEPNADKGVVNSPYNLHQSQIFVIRNIWSALMVMSIFNIFVALNSNKKPLQEALAVAFGLWLALIPPGNLLWIILLIVPFFLKVNHGMMLFSLLILEAFTGIAYSLLDTLGGAALTFPGLFSFFVEMRNTPFIPLTNFYNTLVMGGFLMGLLLFLPVTYFVLLFVKLYRRHIRDRLIKSHFVKMLLKIKLINFIVSKYKMAKKAYDKVKGIL